MKNRITKLPLLACIPFLLIKTHPAILTIESKILDVLIYGIRHVTITPKKTDLMVTFEPTFEDQSTVRELKRIVQNQPKMVIVDFPLRSVEYDSVVQLMEDGGYTSPIIFSYHSQMPEWEISDILSKSNNTNILVGNVDFYDDRYIVNSPDSKPIEVVAAEQINKELSLPRKIYLLTHLNRESFQSLTIDEVDQVQNKIVLYGDIFDPSDQFMTINGELSGLEIIGNLISNILNGTYLKTNSTIDGLLASMIFLILVYFRNWKGLLFTIGTGIALVTILLFYMNFLVNLALILITVLLTYLSIRVAEQKKQPKKS